MVLKHKFNVFGRPLEFESSVIFNGTQTWTNMTDKNDVFESSVIFNDTQTEKVVLYPLPQFESSVSCLLFYYLPYS